MTTLIGLNYPTTPRTFAERDIPSKHQTSEHHGRHSISILSAPTRPRVRDGVTLPRSRNHLSAREVWGLLWGLR